MLIDINHLIETILYLHCHLLHDIKFQLEERRNHNRETEADEPHG